MSGLSVFFCLLLAAPISAHFKTTTTPPPPCCPNGGIWSSWVTTSPCTKGCGGFGTKTQTRYCLTQATCGSCSGMDTQTVPCNMTPCKFPSDSCAPGLKAMAVGSQILCSDGQPTAAETVPQASCCPSGGLLNVWSDWADCDVKCGSCTTTTRTRTCRTEAAGCGPCTESSQTETRPCYTAPCTYPEKSCCAGMTAKSSGGQILCM